MLFAGHRREHVQSRGRVIVSQDYPGSFSHAVSSTLPDAASVLTHRTQIRICMLQRYGLVAEEGFEPPTHGL